MFKKKDKVAEVKEPVVEEAKVVEEPKVEEVVEQEEAVEAPVVEQKPGSRYGGPKKKVHARGRYQ